MDQAVGLPPGKRYRCNGCGNLTRFDIVSRERVRRFWHVDLAGVGTVDEEEQLDVEIETVTCRWCGASDSIERVDVPGSEGLPVGEPTPGA
jgi:hypothetical protein